ncbi:hypothetical protein [Commensalibacter melissae]|nr:hypothetical protein [Commensalibacter melissae]
MKIEWLIAGDGNTSYVGGGNWIRLEARVEARHWDRQGGTSD